MHGMMPVCSAVFGALLPGLRVVRGVDWKWGDQDDGEGHVGTVVEVGGRDGTALPAGVVIVVWDSGVLGNYRAGFENADDLRVLDNASAGVRHWGVTCSQCRVGGLRGFRWSCSVCKDYELCSACYFSGTVHITDDHAFYRQDTPQSERVLVPRRSHARKVQAKGSYAGAKVKRGQHWRCIDQDAAAGQDGEVIDVYDAATGDTWRSYVKIKWDNEASTNHRRGHKGAVDVKYTEASSGETYYVDHLPRLRATSIGIYDSTHSTWPRVHSLPEGKSVGGVATLTNDVFIRYKDGDNIAVFDASTYQFKSNISIPGLKGVTDMAACDRNQCVYIADIKKVVHKVTVGADGANTHYTITRWRLSSKPHGISVKRNSDFNVLVTFRSAREVGEFTTDGKLVRKITLARAVLNPQHAIELNAGELAVCHGEGTDSSHRVCVVDVEGRVLRSYGGQSSGSVDNCGQLKSPERLALGTDGSILVGDCGNRRLLAMNPALDSVREIVSDLKWPSRIWLDERTLRLYVADNKKANIGGSLFSLLQPGAGDELASGRVRIFAPPNYYGYKKPMECVPEVTADGTTETGS